MRAASCFSGSYKGTVVTKVVCILKVFLYNKVSCFFNPWVSSLQHRIEDSLLSNM